MNNFAIKLFACDLNWARYDQPLPWVVPSAPQDFAFIDAEQYFNWHREFGNNVIFCQAYAWSGYAFYPTRLGPTAPGPGQDLLPRLFELSRQNGMGFWSYFCIGADLVMSSARDPWVILASRQESPHGFLAPESPWTDLLGARMREFPTEYPVDWLLLDWFVYGSLKPDFAVQPAWFVQDPFHEIIGRPMPNMATEISPEESLRYKRELLARQFYRIRDAVKETSPQTKIMFNVPYWEAAEPLWVDHPMLNESDGLFAESSKEDVVEWLLSVRQPHQHVMTTIIGRVDEGECDPNTWRKWHECGCDLFGYAWGTPPDFRPHPSYVEQLEIVRQAFHEIIE